VRGEMGAFGCFIGYLVLKDDKLKLPVSNSTNWILIPKFPLPRVPPHALHPLCKRRICFSGLQAFNNNNVSKISLLIALPLDSRTGLIR